MVLCGLVLISCGFGGNGGDDGRSGVEAGEEDQIECAASATEATSDVVRQIQRVVDYADWVATSPRATGEEEPRCPADVPLRQLANQWLETGTVDLNDCDLEDDDIAKLMEHPLFFMVMRESSVLDLGENSDLSCDTAKRIAAYSAVRNLDALKLENVRIEKCGVRKLATSEHLANLRKLNIHDSGMDSEGLSVFASSQHAMSNLEHLAIGHNGIQREQLFHAVSSEYFPRLRTLKVSVLGPVMPIWEPEPPEASNGLRPPPRLSLGYIFEAESLQSLEKLALPQSGLTDEDVEDLVTSPLWGGLESLNLDDNRLSCEAIDFMANAAETKRLKELSLASNSIRGCGLSYFGRENFQNLRHLDLSHNPLESDFSPEDLANYGLEEQAEMFAEDYVEDYPTYDLENLKELEVLLLARTYLDVETVHDIGEVGISENLTELDLDENCMGPEVVEVMEDGGDWNNLEVLSVVRNGLQDGGFQTLIDMLDDAGNVRKLSAGKNELTEDSLKYLTERADVSEQLDYLELRSNDIGDEGLRTLAASWRYGEVEIDLRWNKLGTEAIEAVEAQTHRGHRGLSLRLAPRATPDTLDARVSRRC